MNEEYEHTQVGYVILGAVLGVGVLGVVPALVLVESPGIGFWLIIGAVSVGALPFCSLTVRVTEDALIWYFGPRFWRNTLPLSSIERVERVRNSPLHGWGIRMLVDEWIYNVSGLDAVEIETSDGNVIRIGTDEPDQLATVLRETTQTGGDQKGVRRTLN
ncbi:hypothetical protein BSZ35_10715 [Salinibacter sp. 10B]|nr:hypothetical protein BSZ35_10715 [Salinibacter sp. 10B]